MNKDNKFEYTVGIESTFPKDMPNEHGEIPVWNSENWFYEDVIVGHKIPAGTGMRKYNSMIVGSKEDLNNMLETSSEESVEVVNEENN